MPASFRRTPPSRRTVSSGARPSARRPEGMRVGDDAWRGFVADAMGTSVGRRSPAQREAIDQAMRGDDELPEALLDPAARLARVETLVAMGDDGPTCTLTVRDWRLFATPWAEGGLRAAALLNRTAEDAAGSGDDVAAALTEVLKGLEGLGADRPAVAEVVDRVAAAIAALGASPRP